jgi:hypothetical protein
MKCSLCGSTLIITDVGNQVRPAKVSPCQTCQDGAYANGYENGYEDSRKGKPKKSNTELVKGKR